MLNPSSNHLPRVALISTSAAGFGDVGIGQKIKETLLSDFSVEQFVAASHDSNLDENDLVQQLKELHDPEVESVLEDDELKEYFAAAFKEILAQQDAKSLKDERKAAIKQIFPEVEFEEALQAKVQQYTAFVFFPALEGHAVPKEVQNTAVPQVHLAEYGQRLQKSYITGKDVHYFGFSPLEIGILIPEALDKYYQAHKGESRLEKLQQLAELGIEIQLAVLGSPCTPENVKTFAENSKLYVGYAHDEAMILGFIEAVSRTSPDQNLTICIFKPPVVEVEAKLHAVLNEQQFNSLVVVNYKIEVSSTALDNEGSRQLRLVFLPNCPQPAMHHLLKVSEPETLVTGTQSFLEALALRKSFNYEMYYHLIEFIESFTCLLKEKSPILGNLLANAITAGKGFEHYKQLLEAEFEKGFERFTEKRRSVLEIPNAAPQIAEFFGALKKNPELEKIWVGFIDEICKKYHCANTIRKLVLDASLRNSTITSNSSQDADMTRPQKRLKTHGI